jgi:XapX domain-containing protein
VGFLYWLFKVQSPAPPLIALTGLLGMVVGEHAIPIVKAHFFAGPVAESHADTSARHPVKLMCKEKFKKASVQRDS